MRSNQDTLESRMQGKLARPVWGWGRGEIPRPTPLFFGSPQGGKAAAVFYTLTATCRRLKIDPQAYLKDVFERLPLLLENLSDPQDPVSLAPLLPDRWLADHPESRLQMRVAEADDKAARRRARRTRRRKALARAQRRNR